MKKIRVLTITPNPALDLSGSVERIELNEKTYVQNETRAPGGNAINVARILTRLGTPVLATGFLGGSTGDELAELLTAERVPQHFVKTQEPTRINMTISNRHDHKQTRFSFSGPRITRAEAGRLQKLVKTESPKGILVLGGSMPPQFTIHEVRTLIRSAQKRNVGVVVDCPGVILKDLKIPGLLLIKPNLAEFQEMTQSRVRSLTAVKRKALRLLNVASYICISSVEGGALLVTATGCYFGKISRVKIRSTVGAGDSMVAAMVAQLCAGNSSPAEILRWGLAASAATLSEAGTNLGTAAKMRELYKKTKVVEV